MAEYTHVFRLADIKMCTVSFEFIQYDELNFDLAPKKEGLDGLGATNGANGGEPESPHLGSQVSSSIVDDATQTHFGKTQRGFDKQLYFSNEDEDHFCRYEGGLRKNLSVIDEDKAS